MNFRAFYLSLLKTRALSRALRFAATATLTCAAISSANAYVLNGKIWANGSNVVMQMGLGDAGRTLSDGNTNWNAAAAPALDAWNAQIARMQFGRVMNSTAPASSGDRVNTVAFSNSVFGQAFGSGTLAVTYYIMQGSNLIEADVLFNLAQVFDSYRGNLRYGGSGFALADIRRVFLHELGHAIGMNHSANDDAIMAAYTSDTENLSQDDVSGAQAMYGAPAPQPTPAPTPVPTPVPVPTPTPAAGGGSRLVNISTRMRVGVGDDVAIGGFVVRGGEAKKVLLRAIGPSLAQDGVAGALQDPTLDLKDSTGTTIAQNDNWESGGQYAELAASGRAPSHPAESAMIATLPPGAYTVILRGAGFSQGVALIEAYELDSNSSRLVNLSTRGRVGVGDNVMIGGVVVERGTGKRVVVRAVGPSLAGAVTGPLPDPVLSIYNGNGVAIASSDNWNDSPQRNEIINSGLSPSHGLDSAVLTTLAPGGYTAIVRGVNGTTGVSLIEVYDLE